MPHTRVRYLRGRLEKLLRFSPIVGVVGHRQVGKTTLIGELASSYQTLDLARTRQMAELDPEGFLARLTSHPAAIDEVQHCPGLFPALKEAVRRYKKPGQFLLSGSVRFTSRKAIRESLTGRIVTLELLPFCLSEMESRPLNVLALQLMTRRWDAPLTPRLSASRIKKRNDALLDYGRRGGLPGLCFIRDESVRFDTLESYLQTILDRDLRLILETRLRYTTLRSVLAYLAQTQGNPLNITEMGRKTGVSVPTLRGLLAAFENLFLLRILETRGGEKSPIVFLEDQGEASHLRSTPTDVYTDWLRILYANLRIPFFLAAEESPKFFQWRTRGGAFVPLAVQTTKGILGFLLSLEENPTEAALKSAQAFLKANARSRVLLLSPHPRMECLSERIFQVPIAEIV